MKVFLSIAKELRIHPNRFDRYCCRICNDKNWFTEREAKQGREQTQKDIEKHKVLLHAQNDYFKHLRDNLKQDEVLIIWDFTRFHETAVFKMHDLDLLVFTRDGPNSSPLKRWHWGVFAEGPHDYSYCRTAWNALRKDIDFKVLKKIYIWSYNGLKLKENLLYFSELASQLDRPIEWHFFAPYHGHSECDGHFGQGKKKLRNMLGGSPVSDPEDLFRAFALLPNTVIVNLKQKNRWIRAQSLKGRESATFTVSTVDHRTF